MPSWRDVIKIHPAAELFPLMSADEVKALGEDIKKHGLREQIKVLSKWVKSSDGFSPAIELVNVLIDGRNRLDAMEAAGISIFRMDGHLEDSYFHAISSKEVTDAYAYVISANIHRRHLTAEQKREVIAKLIKATPEKSNRQIADQVKVSHPHVAKVRAELEKTGDVETVSTSIDTKGRRQPIRKARRELADAIEVGPKPDTLERAAEERKAFYARNEETASDVGVDATSPIKVKRGRKISVDDQLRGTISSCEDVIVTAIYDMRVAGWLPELFHGLREMIDRLEAEVDAQPDIKMMEAAE
jgi:hypothetical protein